MLNSTPTRNLKTEEAYENRVRQFRERTARMYGIDPHMVTPSQIVAVLVDQAATLRRSSWRQYRAALRFVLVREAQVSDATSEHHKAIARLDAASPIPDRKAKFKAAIDLSDSSTKAQYEQLLDLRAQIRNFLAHGSFGKRGEAFSFHSGAGAVPLLITESTDHPFHMSGRPVTQDFLALSQIQEFIDWLWSTPSLPLGHI